MGEWAHWCAGRDELADVIEVA